MVSWDDYDRWLGPLRAGELPRKAEPPQPGAIATDSRTLEAGAWFLPWRGETFDGHDFLTAAHQRGGAGCFLQPERAAVPEGWPAIPVTDTHAAFAAVARGLRSAHESLQVAAITGSVGKTTAKEMLAAMLAPAGPVLATRGSFNNEIGLPKTLLRLTPAHRFAVLEMGARHEGDIADLCAIAQPDVGLCLNVGSSHRSEFGSLEATYRAKSEIFAGATTAITWAEDTKLVTAARAAAPVVWTFGRGPNAHVRLETEEWHGEGLTVRLSARGEALTLSFSGGHASYGINGAAATAAALALGASREEIEEGIRTFAPAASRFRCRAFAELVFVDDAYNANPESMRLGFDTLQQRFPKERKVLVLGDMREMGPDSAELHRQVGRLCRGVTPCSRIIAVGEEAAIIADEAERAGVPVHRFEDVEGLIEARLPWRDLGDVIYAKGSRAMKLERVAEALEEAVGR